MSFLDRTVTTTLRQLRISAVSADEPESAFARTSTQSPLIQFSLESPLLHHSIWADSSLSAFLFACSCMFVLVGAGSSELPG